MFRPLALANIVRGALPYQERFYEPGQPRRKMLTTPPDNGTFVKPVKQCLVRNPRTMPMTRLMLILLSGWAGNGGTITTTQGIIAGKISRCRRQVIRYLKDAMEEGLLIYWRTKDRMGYYTGIKIWLNFGAIRHIAKGYKKETYAKTAESRAMTYESQINRKDNIKIKVDTEFRKKIVAICKRNGIEPPPLPT